MANSFPMAATDVCCESKSIAFVDFVWDAFLRIFLKNAFIHSSDQMNRWAYQSFTLDKNNTQDMSLVVSIDAVIPTTIVG